MKIILIFFTILFTLNSLSSREIGETEITAEEGIEVFQNEKYYLLKKNVKIISDNFILEGDVVKLFFEKDLYDITKVDAKGNVDLTSSLYAIKASGDNLYFILQNEEIQILGKNSILVTEDTEMYSDGKIRVENKNGNFELNGLNSSLKNNNIIIEGYDIKGTFSTNSESKEIIFLDVYDKSNAYINNGNTEMYGNKINYSKKTSLIELEDNVKIIRDGELITGDYGTLDTNNNSYKIKSKDEKKVIAIISDTNE
tara:strand:+ start:1056 stop:1820 length:765 start_codon:yes stop_codon:yes gene_type:complete